MKRHAAPAVACAVLLTATTAGAAVVRVVDNDGHGSTADCNGVLPAYTTIGAAIADAAFGDSVVVCPGTYVENVNFGGKSIPVRGLYGANLTIIDGNGADSVVTFAAGEGLSAVLEGFTIRNGFSNFNSPGFGDGGGIRISGASPVIRNNLIVGNRACTGLGIFVNFGSPFIEGNVIAGNTQSGCSGGPGGGGIAILGSSQAVIRSNTITQNTIPVDGGGISLFAAGAPTIERNVISGNIAGGSGGGIWIVNQSDALITGNVISGNSAAHGGGVYWLVPQGARGPLLVNNTIAGNNSPEGSGIMADGFDIQAVAVNNVVVAALGQTAIFCGNFNDTNPPMLRFNNVFSASGPEYGGACIDQTGINGNISAAPLFANANAGDYRLKAGSPGIDAGDNGATGISDLDQDGSPRLADGDSVPGAIVDIGADEISPTPKVSLKINGEYSYPYSVFTPGPVQYSLDIAPTTYSLPVDWYWAITLNNQAFWITATGVSATPAPFLHAPPVPLTDVPLLNLALPPGASLGSIFGMLHNGLPVTVVVNNVTAVNPN